MAKLLLFMFLVGCATPYQPQGFSGGYSEEDVGNGVTAVHYRGNGFTSADTVATYAMKRASDYCKEQGHNGYDIVNSAASQDVSETPMHTSCSSYGSETTCRTRGGNAVTKHSATLFIRCTDMSH